MRKNEKEPEHEYVAGGLTFRLRPRTLVYLFSAFIAVMAYFGFGH